MALSRSWFLRSAVTSLAAASPQLARAQEAPLLRVAAVASEAFAEAYYAKEMGFFQAAGLNVEITTFSAGAPVAIAVAGGAADIGITNVVSLGVAVEHGVPFQFICSGGMFSPDLTALCVLSDSGITTGKDLEGKVVATGALHDVNAIAILGWVDQHGGDSSKVRLVEMPFPEMGPALRRGTIAAAPIAQPSLTVAQRAGGIRRLEPNYMEVYSKHFMMGGWFATAPWIAAHRPVVSKFVGAIYTTARWANTHLNESALILAKYAKMDPALATSIGHTPYGESLTPAMIQPVLDTALKYGGLEHPLKAGDVIARV